jgi:hypothetical protein
MTAHVRRVLAVIAVFTLALFGLAPSASAAGHAAKPQHHGLQHFLGLQSNPAETATPTIIATGPIHARGTDTVVDDNNDVFTFPAGTLSVFHSPTSQHDSFDPVTCLARHSEKGNYRITGGTGAYAQATGKGHYTVSVIVVGCDQSAPPTVFQLVIDAKGPIQF